MDTLIVCTKCKVGKDQTAFSQDPQKKNGLCSQCRECRNEGILTRRHQDPEVRWHQDLVRNYGITGETYNALFEGQAGLCAICEQPETATYRGRLMKLSVDHDHGCCPGKKSCGQCVRGLLCNRCNNRVLGSVSDDINILKAAVVYLGKGMVA
jgi:hypothetical protein